MIVALSRRALHQIEEIIRYTDTNFGTNVTESYIAGLYRTFDLIGAYPQIGQPFDGNRRRYLYQRHQIYYRATDARILILDIRHVRQSPHEP